MKFWSVVEAVVDIARNYRRYRLYVRSTAIYPRAVAGGEAVYRQVVEVLEERLLDPELAARLQRADTVVRYELSDIGAELTLDVRADGDPCVIAGKCSLEPQVILTMSAETALAFLLGHVNVTVALARGEIQVHGRVHKLLKLVTLVRPALTSRAVPA
jgi:hypothetical protein